MVVVDPSQRRQLRIVRPTGGGEQVGVIAIVQHGLGLLEAIPSTRLRKLFPRRRVARDIRMPRHVSTFAARFRRRPSPRQALMSLHRATIFRYGNIRRLRRVVAARAAMIAASRRPAHRALLRGRVAPAPDGRKNLPLPPTHGDREVVPQVRRERQPSISLVELGRVVAPHGRHPTRIPPPPRLPRRADRADSRHEPPPPLLDRAGGPSRMHGPTHARDGPVERSDPPRKHAAKERKDAAKPWKEAAKARKDAGKARKDAAKERKDAAKPRKDIPESLRRVPLQGRMKPRSRGRTPLSCGRGP